MPRKTTLFAIGVALALAAVAPLASAYQSYPYTTISTYKKGDEYVLGGGAVSRGDPSGNRIAYFSGDGWVEYSFLVSAGAVSPDDISIRSQSAGWSNSLCRFEVISGSRGVLMDSGWRNCNTNYDALWWQSSPPWDGTIVVRITYQGPAGAYVGEVGSTLGWGMMSTDVRAYAAYSSTDVSEGRTSLPPGTCVKIPIRSSPAHTTLLDIDWGDGTSIVLDGNGGTYGAVREACHPYAPSAAPYQMCARLRETNGLQRATPSDCRDLPFMLPSL